MVFIKEDIKKMAELLRSGNTMLNVACPVCNNPVFKNKKGKLFCPRCNREVVIVEENSPQSELINNNLQEQNNNVTEETYVELKECSVRIKKVITEKIDWIVTKIKQEIQLENIEKYLNLLLKCYEVLERIKN